MKRAGVVVRGLLLVVVLAFVGWTAWDLAQRWHASEPVAIRWPWLVAAVLPIVGVSLAQALGWLSLVQHMTGRTLPRRAALELFLASMLGRYVPAKVGMPAILMSRARQLDLSATAMASSMLLIVLVYTLLGVGIGVASVGLAGAGSESVVGGLRTGLGAAAIAGMVLGVLVLLVLDRRRFPSRLLARLDAQDGRGPLVGPGLVAWYTLVWLCWWAHGALLVLATGGTASEAVAGAGFFVLAPVLGFLALVAPGGLGVREAVIAAGIGPFVGAGAAVVAAIVSRFVSLSIDVAMWATYRRLRGPLEPPDGG